MAAKDGLITGLSYREHVASPGSYVDFASNLFAFPTSDGQPETLPTADGIDLRVRDRDGFAIQIYDISTLAALNTLMTTRKVLDVKFTFGWGSLTYKPCRFTVRPILSQVPDRAEVLIGATDAGDDVEGVDSGDWTSLGSVLDGSQANFTPNTTNDGLGLPIYTSMSFEHTFDLIDDGSTAIRTTLASYQRAKCRLAWKQSNGDYLFYESVTMQYIPYAPGFGVAELLKLNAQVSAVKANWTSIATLPASPVDYVTGYELRIAAASAAQADYLTVA